MGDLGFIARHATYLENINKNKSKVRRDSGVLPGDVRKPLESKRLAVRAAAHRAPRWRCLLRARRPPVLVPPDCCCSLGTRDGAPPP